MFFIQITCKSKLSTSNPIWAENKPNMMSYIYSEINVKSMLEAVALFCLSISLWRATRTSFRPVLQFLSPPKVTSSIHASNMLSQEKEKASLEEGDTPIYMYIMYVIPISEKHMFEPTQTIQSPSRWGGTHGPTIGTELRTEHCQHVRAVPVGLHACARQWANTNEPRHGTTDS